MASLLNSCSLTDREGKELDKSVLAKAERVALYFSADFCKPCHEFLPILKDFYDEVNDDGKRLEVIFVSLDKSEEEQEKYHKQMGNWPKIAYANGDVRLGLKAKYSVEKIPSIIVLDNDKESAKFTDGVNDVRNMGPMAFDMKWGN